MTWPRQEACPVDLPPGYLVVHANAGKSFREWPAERFAAVARRLGRPVAVVGGPGDRPTFEAIRGGLAGLHAEFLSPDVPGLIGLFRRAGLLLCNESGPMHVAALTACPIAAIYGPTAEALWRPHRREGVMTLRGSDCDPRCGKRVCHAGNRCLTALSIEAVTAACRRLLGT